MSDRSFDRDEIREILARATEPRDQDGTASAPDRTLDGPGNSLTLVELQEVAAEVGISPERIAEAATDLDIERTLIAPRTYVGVPISAEHVVRLPRMLEPEEWDRFVVRLRDTFDARGTVSTEGSLQTWSNGNLNVMLEPLEAGARLRFKSLHGESKSYLDGSVASGVSGLMLAATIGALSVFGGETLPAAIIGIAVGVPVLAAGMWAVGRAKAARWLPVRRAGFLALGAEAMRVVTADSDGGAPPSE